MSLKVEELKLSPAFGKVFCEPGWRWNTVGRAFDDFDLWYVWSGEGDLILNGVRSSVSAGSCYLFRPGDETVGRHDPNSPLTVSFIHFQMPKNAAAHYPSYHQIKDRLTFETYLTRYARSLMEKQSRSETEAAHLLFLLLLQFEGEGTSEADKGLHENQELLSIIHESASYIRQFPGMKHTVAALAERARLSERYFSRKFRAIMGRTLEAYVIDMKIERAEHLLRYYGMNVSEVADALDYGSVYYFSRQFKQYRGVAPSELRKR